MLSSRNTDDIVYSPIKYRETEGIKDNHNTALLSVATSDNCLYVFDEIYVNEMNTNQIIELANRKRLYKSLTMICDSEDPDKINIWACAGYNARKVNKYPGSVNAQIDRLKRYDKIYINTKCVNTWKEAKAWQWKQTKQGKFIDEPMSIFDDAMASLRYSGDIFTESKGTSIDWGKVVRK